MTFTMRDIAWIAFRNGHPDGVVYMRATHMPTGQSVTGEDVSQMRLRDRLLAELRVLVAKAVCDLCAKGVPHHTNSITSIGGADRVTCWDLHAVEDTGGVGLAECTAAEIWEDRPRYSYLSPASGTQSTATAHPPDVRLA